MKQSRELSLRSLVHTISKYTKKSTLLVKIFPRTTLGCPLPILLTGPVHTIMCLTVHAKAFGNNYCIESLTKKSKRGSPSLLGMGSAVG